MARDDKPGINPQDYLTKGQRRALSYLACLLVAALMLAYTWHVLPNDDDGLKAGLTKLFQQKSTDLTPLTPPAPQVPPVQAQAPTRPVRPTPIVWQLGDRGNRPILLRNVTITIENPGTNNAEMVVDIGQISPQCSPDGEGGEPRPRLIATVHYAGAPDTVVTVREFPQGKKDNYSEPPSKVPIGNALPVNVDLHVRGGCGG